MAKKIDSVSFVKEKVEEGENWTVMRQIMINRSFYNSQQWISWDNVGKRVYIPELRPGEKRLTFNKIKPAVLTLLSKLCKNRVKLEVKPDTNDIERIEVAKASYKYLGYQWDADGMDRKIRRLKFHMLLDGFPALKVFIDKTQGDDLTLEDEALLDEVDIKQIPTKTGKIVTMVIDQFAIFVDPSAEAVEEIRWAIEKRPVDVDQIFEEWGEEVEPESNISIRQSFDTGLMADAQKKYKNHAVVYDYWEFPCPKYPKGRRIVVSGDKELLKTDDPGENPYIFFPAIPIPGTAVATGIVTDMTTPQKSYNIKRTAEARILEEMGNPIWLRPAGSLPNDGDELVNEIGADIEYTPVAGMRPERVQGASVDAGWQNAMERDEADIEDISGAHEISQGATPRGNNTLGGLQLQVEQDETKLALLVQSYEDGIKLWGEKVLRLLQKHFPEEQQLSIVGENGEIEAFAFSGADLSGKEVVDVVPGSSMPTLKAVQDEKIMAMYGAGMFTDPRTGAPDTRRVVRMLGESIAHQYFDETEQDENKALMENRTWVMAFQSQEAQQALMEHQKSMQEYAALQGDLANMGINAEEIAAPPQLQLSMKLPIVRDFYDHEVHITAHNRFRKSNDYDDLPPEFQALIDAHVTEHEQMLMAPQLEAQQQAEAEAQAQAEATQQQAASAKEAEQATKMQDHYNALEKEVVKGEIAERTAAIRAGRG